LRIDPCIPSAWDGFTAERTFRGCRLHIRVNNPQHVCRGVGRMEVDGLPVEGNLVTLDGPGSEYFVEVWLARCE